MWNGRKQKLKEGIKGRKEDEKKEKIEERKKDKNKEINKELPQRVKHHLDFLMKQQGLLNDMDRSQWKLLQRTSPKNNEKTGVREHS